MSSPTPGVGVGGGGVGRRVGHAGDVRLLAGTRREHEVVGARRAGFDEGFNPVAAGEQHDAVGLRGRQRHAVPSQHVEVVTFEGEGHELALGGVEHAPALHFAWVHRDLGVHDAVDGVENLGAREEGLLGGRERDGDKQLEVVAQLDGLEHYDLLLGGRHLLDLVELAAHDDHAGHAGPHLLANGAVAVGVVPVAAAGVVVRDGDLVLLGRAGRHAEEDVVAIALRRDVQAVRVEVGRRPLVRAVRGERVIRVLLLDGRQLVDQVYPEGVAGPHLPGLARHDAVEGVGGDRLRGADVDGRGDSVQDHVQLPVGAREDLGLGELDRPTGSVGGRGGGRVAAVAWRAGCQQGRHEHARNCAQAVAERPTPRQPSIHRDPLPRTLPRWNSAIAVRTST